ncbi:kinase [Paenibacillus sp. HWE-109]|uniref:kinase n=1 Tax=Paenibacillus sp. HWE-109 TaxID=1306526 RepID=UPI001EE03382|nr:kinase [Paenibacillus sp. HWE-109]UKS26813.1 kinase [Paenibacillus sp. HWE-109]
MQQDWLHYAIPFVIIAFFIYRRTKRSIGFQKLSPGRLKFRVILFGILGLLIFLLGFVHPIHFIAYIIGLAAGTALGLTAIRHTRFEHRADGWYYRTHLWVEIAVLVLFLSRVVYRIAFISLSANPASMNPADPTQFTKDPLTAGVFFIIVSYYILFFGYLLREKANLDPAALAGGISNGNEATVSPAANVDIAK